MAGKLERCYQVFCGMCRKKENPYGREKKYAERELRHNGWMNTTVHGWICPTCKVVHVTTKAKQPANQVSN